MARLRLAAWAGLAHLLDRIVKARRGRPREVGHLAAGQGPGPAPRQGEGRGPRPAGAGGSVAV